MDVQEIITSSHVTKHMIARLVWDRLNNGKGRCHRKNFCLYENEDGTNNCAAGHLIPDGHPGKSPDVTGSVEHLIKIFSKNSDHPLPDFFYENSMLISDFQMIHDMYEYWDEKSFNPTGIRAFQNHCYAYGIDFEKISSPIDETEGV